MDAKRLLLVVSVLLASLAVVPLSPTAAATSHTNVPSDGIPNAAFGYTQMFAYGNFYVRFTDTTTEIVPVKWEWKFGDGYTAVGQATAHRYREAGTYNVTLTAYAEDGTLAIVTEEIVVESSATFFVLGLFFVTIIALAALWLAARGKHWWLVVVFGIVLALSGVALLERMSLF